MKRVNAVMAVVALGLSVRMPAVAGGPASLDFDAGGAPSSLLGFVKSNAGDVPAIRETVVVAGAQGAPKSLGRSGAAGGAAALPARHNDWDYPPIPGPSSSWAAVRQLAGELQTEADRLAYAIRRDPSPTQSWYARDVRDKAAEFARDAWNSWGPHGTEYSYGRLKDAYSALARHMDRYWHSTTWEVRNIFQRVKALYVDKLVVHYDRSRNGW